MRDLGQPADRAGFTLLEAVFAAALFGLVMVAVFAAFSTATRLARAGVSQVRFTAQGRVAAQKITRIIEEAKAVGASSNALNLVTLGFGSSRIYFDSGDGDVSSVADNTLVYVPVVGATGGVETLCTHVSPVAGTPMFSVSVSTSAAARVVFHVGDGTNVEDAVFTRTGMGYQGLEVRLSASPRNLQLWHD